MRPVPAPTATTETSAEAAADASMPATTSLAVVVAVPPPFVALFTVMALPTTPTEKAVLVPATTWVTVTALAVFLV